MSGSKAVLDTNVIIFASKQKLDINKLLSGYDHFYVSIITYMEVYGYRFDSEKEKELGEKFWFFSQLPSLREYVLIEQDRWAVETRYRSSAESSWVMDFFEGLDTEIVLKSLGIRLPMEQVYYDIEGL